MTRGDILQNEAGLLHLALFARWLEHQDDPRLTRLTERAARRLHRRMRKNK